MKLSNFFSTRDEKFRNKGVADKYFVHKQCCLIVAVGIALSVSNPKTQENCVRQELFSL